jgi:hypothetical protein
MQQLLSKGGFMRKFILGTIIVASLATVAARQPAVSDGDHMQMMMQNCPMSGGMMGSVNVKYEATENGARLTFTPKDPAMLSELQTRIREMAERMGKADGSMMMRGMMPNRENEERHDFHHPAK